MFQAFDRKVAAHQEFEAAGITSSRVSAQLLSLARRETACTQLVEQVLGVKLDDGSWRIAVGRHYAPLVAIHDPRLSMVQACNLTTMQNALPAGGVGGRTLQSPEGASPSASLGGELATAPSGRNLDQSMRSLRIFARSVWGFTLSN